MERFSVAGAAVLAAVFMLSSLTALPQPASAQVGLSSLAGRVCSIDQEIYYIQAPQAGDTAGCGGNVPGATLRLSKPGVGGTAVGAVDQTATTDANGTYQFPQLADGNYSLAVSHVGYEALNLTVRVQSATVRDIGLQPKEVTVEGTLKDDQGAPVADATIEVCCAPRLGGVKAVTGADGAFSVRTQAGERTFTARKDGAFLLSHTQFVDGTQAVALVAPPVPQPDAVIHGVVRDQDGTPISGLSINAYSYGPCCEVRMAEGDGDASGASSGASSVSYSPSCCYGGNSVATTDSQGRYSLRLYGGATVSVNAHREGYAGYYKTFEMGKGEDRTLDITLLKFPAKTARLEGTVVDDATGKALQHVSISVQAPAYGLYECSQGPETAPPMPQKGSAEPEADTAQSMPVHDEGNGCAIQVRSDGSFQGDVTPGYSIVQVSFDSYRACPPSQDGMYRPCAPEYYSWAQSINLPADKTTQLTVRLQARPGPDAVVSGYLVDAETGNAIPNGQVNFNSEDGYGYGFATTDKDGSYKVKVRSGHLSVHASAEGHLRWVGMLTAESGETAFDIQMTPGQDSGGGCCMIAYATPGMTSSSSDAAARSGASEQSSASSKTGGTASAFEDLGGGLGPYDATARSRTLQDASGRSIPAAGPLLLLALLGCAAMLRRR